MQVITAILYSVNFVPNIRSKDFSAAAGIGMAAYSCVARCELHATQKHRVNCFSVIVLSIQLLATQDMVAQAWRLFRCLSKSLAVSKLRWYVDVAIGGGADADCFWCIWSRLRCHITLGWFPAYVVWQNLRELLTIVCPFNFMKARLP